MNGDDLKQEGMELALENESEEFKNSYAFHAFEFLKMLAKGQEFRGEQINLYVEGITGFRPHHPNVKGALFYSWVKPLLNDGVVTCTGFVKSSRHSNHARVTRVYRKN